MTAAQTLFVDGSVFASSHWRTDTAGTGLGGSNDLNGTVAGGGFAVGTWLTPHLSLRLETSLAAELEGTVESEVMPALAELSVIGLPYPGYPWTTRVADRTRTMAPLLAYHTARRGGVQLAYLGGAAFVWQRTRTSSDIYLPLYDPVAPGIRNSERLANLPLREYDVTTTHYATTAMVGVDADIRLTRRLSVVPQLRALAFGGGLNLRSGVAARLHW